VYSRTKSSILVFLSLLGWQVKVNFRFFLVKRHESGSFSFLVLSIFHFGIKIILALGMISMLRNDERL